MARIAAYEYFDKEKDFVCVGFSQNARMWFRMLEWKIVSDEYMDLIDQTGQIFFFRVEHENHLGVFHWTKEGLLNEIKEKGLIS